MGLTLCDNSHTIVMKEAVNVHLCTLISDDSRWTVIRASPDHLPFVVLVILLLPMRLSLLLSCSAAAGGKFYHMSSFMETRADRYMKGREAGKFVE